MAKGAEPSGSGAGCCANTLRIYGADQQVKKCCASPSPNAFLINPKKMPVQLLKYFTTIKYV